MPLFSEIIAKKRDGGTLSGEDIAAFVDHAVSGEASEAQIAALLMACFLRGLDANETAQLTIAMTNSGTRLDWSHLKGPVADKHSSGGVGDKVSLVLAPLLAACGVYVPMLSGRGLGHTGGTLDKLESIEGVKTDLGLSKFKEIVERAGCAIAGAGPEIAPADKVLYALRDQTATVANTGLITASILSKKLAGGADYLLMDVKCGNGAFCQTKDEALKLAHSIANAGRLAGLPTDALVSDMNSCLGTTAGPALELREALGYLMGHQPDPRFDHLIKAQAEKVLISCGAVQNKQEADHKIRQAISSKSAAGRFEEMIQLMGSKDQHIEEIAENLPVSRLQRAFRARQNGYFTKVDTTALGYAVIDLGGGRAHSGDRVDFGAGLSHVRSPNCYIHKGESLLTAHASDDAVLDKAFERLENSFEIRDEPLEEQAPIISSWV